MKYVYHSSTLKNLKVLEPKRTTSVDGDYIGDYIFATKNIIYSAMYLVKIGNATLMNPKDKKPYIIIQNTPSNYLSLDKGGAIYTLPGKTFHKSPQVGLDKTELVSEVRVRPIRAQTFDNSLTAMSGMGIRIYFVNKQTFQKLLDTKNDSLILPTLEEYKLSS